MKKYNGKNIKYLQKVGLNIVEFILETIICTVLRLVEEHEFYI
jgi:hypothetical protein